MLNLLFFFLVNISLLLADTESTCSNSVIVGPVTYVDGSSTDTDYIIQAGGTGSGKWGTITTSGSTVTLGLGPRAYYADTCATAFASNVFQKFNPLGSTISFTANLANVGCGTDAAFYLVNMPAAGAGGTGDYYCDSNDGNGYYCTEMDLMEANRHALQITAHKCTSLTGGCDGGGCAINTQSIENGFGPSSSYTINTENSFNVAITFGTSSGALSTITSKITQGSKSITLTHSSSNCGSGYLSTMDTAFKDGMVPVLSFWSGSVSWLDSPACSSNTDEISNPSFVFSNFKITSPGVVSEVSDESAMGMSSGLTLTTIVGIAVGAIVAVVIVIVVIVVVLKKKKQTEEYV